MEFRDKVKGYLNNSKSDFSTLTKFLNLSEQVSLTKLLAKKMDFSLFGGYSEAEFKRATINNNDNDFKISCIKIIYKDKYLKITHQNILGTLLSLSIERDSIGDILPELGVFFIISELKEFILSEFKQINNVSIELTEIDPVNIRNTPKLELYSITVTSLRLDLVVSKITKMSRMKAIEYIENDLVKLNHEVTNKNTKNISEEEIISIRKYGRFIIIDTKKRSKKGKTIVKYGKYV